MYMKHDGAPRRRQPEQAGPESSRELAAFAGVIAVAVGLSTLLFTRSILLSLLLSATAFIVTFSAFLLLRLVANSSDQYSPKE